MPKQIGAWLHIDEKGAVTVFTGKVEVGQNARTSLTQSVAEELGAPLTSIEVVMGDTDADSVRHGNVRQHDHAADGSATSPRGSGGSSTVAAGPMGKIDFAEIGKNPSIEAADAGAAKFKPTAEWKVLGTSPHKVHGRDIVTGGHKYTSDMKLPGMLYGRVLRPDRFNAKLVSLDASAAKEKQGVTVVRDGEFRRGRGSTPTAAANALAALKPNGRLPADVDRRLCSPI